MSPLVISKILGLFVNTLTADGKYYLRKMEKLLQPIQMHLSKRKQYFYNFFGALMKFASNLEHFAKTINLIAYVFKIFRL